MENTFGEVTLWKVIAVEDVGINGVFYKANEVVDYGVVIDSVYGNIQVADLFHGEIKDFDIEGLELISKTKQIYW